MNRAQKILQAYRNTPWRRQTQMLSRLAALGLVAAVVMMVYTWMTSQAGTYGIKVQEYQATALAAQQNIEDKNAELADLTSNENLALRATQMGYQPVDPNRVRYLEVEGYYPEPTLALAPPPNAAHQAIVEETGLPEEYTTSLFEWLQETISRLRVRRVGGE
ncbi:MAG: hypothetical protein JW757_11645 [Anaerolineales bacterium]|nr:hypothetical protein [Anaerolineales bacterium]